MSEENTLSMQYGGDAAALFEQRNRECNRHANEHFYSLLPSIVGKSLLDAGCGEGSDLLHYVGLGAKCFGLDSGADMVHVARKRGIDACLGNFESLPFADATFDVVVSKYAIQTSAHVPKVLSEFGRVLKSGGILQYLAVHPMRQFIERKKPAQNYFKQTIVDSVLFGGALTVKEPTHTLNEYLNPDFLREFEITHFEEREHFSASEQIDGQTYPCYFIVQAKKR